jgi:hypothetical protein
LGASKVNSILELSPWEQATSMLFTLLAPKDLFPVCCWLCLLSKTYFQYVVYFACFQRLNSSMMFTLLAPKDLFPVCCWLSLLPKTYFQYAVGFACSQRLISKESKQHTGNKSLGASKDNNILEISHWEQAK